jgi:putative ABC transport system substrate-binding protein
MRRREFIAALGATAAAPLGARAQQGERVRRIGAIIARAEHDPDGHSVTAAFRLRLERLGWIEGKNIHIEFRYPAGNSSLYQTYATELVGLAPDALLAGSSQAVAVLKPLTGTIPIVFVLTADPVAQGFVQSLARPGGNITGFSADDPPLMGKWLSLLKEIAPSTARIAVLFNPDTAPYAEIMNNAINSAALTLGMKVTLAPVRSDGEIEQAVGGHAQQPAGALVLLPETLSALTVIRLSLPQKPTVCPRSV